MVAPSGVIRAKAARVGATVDDDVLGDLADVDHVRKGIERAIKMLKRKLASEGVLRELKMRRHYMKPSVKRRKKQAEAARRRRKRAKMDAAPPKS